MNVFGKMMMLLGLLLTSLALVPNQQLVHAHDVQPLRTSDFTIAPELQTQFEQVHTVIGRYSGAHYTYRHRFAPCIGCVNGLV
ncbi:hypothetical protein Hgul01_05202 [Herpetosiphon gulosus]|uniref:Uncharacterized protein n=1 Tax=Herpetosiphon gulosus TaxID=1973496 RepID=A0ABP9X7L8_9CHLR